MATISLLHSFFFFPGLIETETENDLHYGNSPHNSTIHPPPPPFLPLSAACHPNTHFINWTLVSSRPGAELIMSIPQGGWSRWSHLWSSSGHTCTTQHGTLTALPLTECVPPNIVSCQAHISGPFLTHAMMTASVPLALATYSHPT